LFSQTCWSFGTNATLLKSGLGGVPEHQKTARRPNALQIVWGIEVLSNNSNTKSQAELSIT